VSAAAALRIALLVPPGDAGTGVGGLAAALRARGHTVTELASTPPTPLDRLLAQRGFEAPLTRVPRALATLRGQHHDLVHAFTPLDAAAALRARRRIGAPVVFTWLGAFGREQLSGRRLRLRLVTEAVERSDAMTVTAPAAQAGAQRWLAVDLPVLALEDGAGYEALYRSLLAVRAQT
jgi:hypothetical protein